MGMVRLAQSTSHNSVVRLPPPCRPTLWIMDLHSDAFYADPHPAYAALREASPVHLVRDPRGLEYWLITRFDDAKAALADPRLAKDPRLAWDALKAAGLVSGEPGEATFDLHTTDPPEHTRLRGLVSKAFTPGRVEGMRVRVQEICDGLLSALPVGSPVDLIASFAYPFSLTVIAELIGVPPIDFDRFREWTTAAMTPATRAEGGRLLHEYITELVAKKQESGPDLLSALLAERDLTHAQLIALTQQLLFAGHEPSMNMLGNGLIALLRHPDQFELLRNRPELLPSAVDELLRFDGPTVRASPRYPTEDVTIGGTLIPAGSVIIVGIASANRDPRRFTEPDRLDIGRSGGHIAFGHGIHRCLGVGLARLEGEIGIGSLVRRYSKITLAGELEWHPFPVFRGLVSLPVILSE
jgi:cytochrome P450